MLHRKKEILGFFLEIRESIIVIRKLQIRDREKLDQSIQERLLKAFAEVFDQAYPNWH
jgi:hypothetical protein